MGALYITRCIAVQLAYYACASWCYRLYDCPRGLPLEVYESFSEILADGGIDLPQIE